MANRPPLITVTVADAAVSGTEPGFAATVSGSVYYRGYTNVKVRGSAGGLPFDAIIGTPVEDERDPEDPKAVLGFRADWSAEGRFYRPGPVAIKAEVYSSDKVATSAATFMVTLDRTKPSVTIVRPAAGNLRLSELGERVGLDARTGDQFGRRSISWDCEGQHGTASPDPADAGRFTAEVPLAAMPLGPRTVTVTATCVDAPDIMASTSVTLTARDETKPTLSVLEPAPYQTFVLGSNGLTVTVRGTAVDRQSGMVGGQVMWALTDSGPSFKPASTSDDWANWHVEIPITDVGTYTIYLTAADRDKNSTPIVRVPVQVVSSYQPRNLGERISPRSYLSALLAFAREQVTVPGGGQLSSADLQAVFLQSFGLLSQPLSEIGDAGEASVNQLLVAAEILRRYSPPGGPPLVAGHWSFDAATVDGGVVADLSGNGGSGIAVGGVVLEAGRFVGQAIRFDGTRSVRITNTPALQVGTAGADFSVSFHIYPYQGPGNQWRSVAHKGSTDQERTFALWLHPSSNRLHARISTRTDAASIWNDGLDSIAEAPVGRWTHVAYVKAGNELRLFLDGRLDNVVTLEGQSVSNIGPLYLGKDPWYAGFDGLLDDVCVFGFALDSVSVNALASGGDLDASATTTPAEGQAGYLWAAYEAFLAGVGTSYEELRLARGAEPAVRNALADRLGIRLTPATPDELDQLTLDPARLTEDRLEQVFGMRDTDVEKAILRPPVTALLLQWRVSALLLRWAEADQAASAADREFPVLVEPDLIGLDDLVTNVVNDPARTLLATRREEVRLVREGLRLAREGAGPTTADQMRALLAKGLPGVDLLQLRSVETAGKDIGPTLRGLMLARETYQYLVRAVRVAAVGTVTDAEWQDLYDILTQVEKSRRYPMWRTQEGAIALTTDHFRVSDRPVSLPRWRATRRARDAWRLVLQGRIDERASTEEAYRSLSAAVDEIALPRLRDALVHSKAIEDLLTRRLQIDVKAGGRLRTTRIGQATETLQNLLFSVRTGQLPEGHPANGWIAADETAFDDAWRWLGTYEAWRAAMFVFLYPENILLPALRPDATPAFGRLVADLRRRQQITAEDARTLAAAVLAAQLPALHGDQGLPAPVAQWTFDDGGGDTASEPGGSTGTLAGPQWTSGAIGGALAFDGIADVVSVVSSPQLKDAANTFTISFWASPESPHEIDPQSTDGTRGTSGQRYAYGPLYGGAADQAGVGVSVGTNGISVYEHSGAYMPAVLTYEAPVSGWTHVAVIYEDRTPKLYVNGRLASKSNTQSPKLKVRPEPDGLGGMSYGHFHGKLDDVRVYAETITDHQVEVLAFRLTDQHTDADLDALRTLSKRLLEPRSTGGPPYLEAAAGWLSELLCFVPLALAAALQASGEYLAALDWYQTVYAYNLPVQRREIYYGLTLEHNDSPNLAATGDWFRRLNPHVVAAARPNPYTRYVLMSLARCCIEFADTEFTRDNGESVARARSLYAVARDLLALPSLRPVIDAAAPEWPLSNPTLDGLKERVQVQLTKLRQGRNIAGLQRVDDAGASPSLPDNRIAVGPAGPVPPRPGRPTAYRYRALVERGKQLVALAQQVEAAYLDALEKYGVAAFRRFDANKGVELTEAGVTLQGLRVTEATHAVSLAHAQRDRADALGAEYQRLIDAGLNEHENAMLDGYWNVSRLQTVIGGIDAAIGAAGVALQAGGIDETVLSFGSSVAVAVSMGLAHAGRAVAGGFLNDAQARLQSNSLLASHDRLVESWQTQRNSAQQDAIVAEQQVLVATDQKAIVGQEERIARTQAQQAKATVDFLDRQFTNQELYEWMSGVLAGVYRYFLQQATALARMAQDQLAFERQEPPPTLVRSDYWNPPSDGAGTARSTKDRRGLTGSAGLLQDIYQLDQYAFETDKRKLNLSQTFSLAQRGPLQFELFRSSGVLPFATPMEWFDEDFPGHYLRMIKRVSLTVVALIPPSRGIRATLANSGISRVVVGGDTFREVVVRRDPQMVALTSPLVATGVFDLDTQSDLLLPFESVGVDTTWGLQMPRAANPFDYESIADVLMTVEYTALHSEDYRHQLVERFNRDLRRRGDRAFSLRQDFPDAWYDLHNPAVATDLRAVRLRLQPMDFPSNIDGAPRVEQLVLYLMTQNGPVDPVNVTLTHQGQGGAARSDQGLISTRRGNAETWTKIRDTDDATGAWDLTFAPEASEIFDGDRLKDVLFVVGYVGQAPAWPA